MKDISQLLLPRPEKCDMVEGCQGIPKWLPCIYFNGNKGLHLMLDIGCCDDHKVFDVKSFVELNQDLIEQVAPLINLPDGLNNPEVFYEKVEGTPEA